MQIKYHREIIFPLSGQDKPPSLSCQVQRNPATLFILTTGGDSSNQSLSGDTLKVEPKQFLVYER